MDLLAYVGPGAGLGFLGSLVAIVAVTILGIIGLLAYPLKLLLRMRHGHFERSANDVTDVNFDNSTSGRQPVERRDRCTETVSIRDD